MSALMDQIANAIVTVGVNGDGYQEHNARVPVPGHDVQIVHERGSEFYTVFVDGKCGQMKKEKVAGWIAARL